jgi:opacity protein-like surface antigen
MIFIKSIIVSVLLLSATLSADETRFSAHAFAGYNEVSLTYHPAAKLKARSGPIVGVSGAYNFTDRFSVELEGCYRCNEVQRLELKGKDNKFIVPLNGDIKAASLHSNAILKLPFLPALVPYIGLGIGLTGEHSNWNANIIEDSLWIDLEAGTRMALSYQLIGGIHMPKANGYYCGIEFRILDSILDHMCNHNRSLIFSYHKVF